MVKALGFLMGDERSAYAVVLKALRLAASRADGQRPPLLSLMGAEVL
jgi:hypothetical protein